MQVELPVVHVIVWLLLVQEILLRLLHECSGWLVAWKGRHHAGSVHLVTRVDEFRNLTKIQPGEVVSRRKMDIARIVHFD